MLDHQADQPADNQKKTEREGIESGSRIPRRCVGTFGTRLSSQQARKQRYRHSATPDSRDYDAFREVLLEDEEEEIEDYWRENLPPHWSS